MTDPFKPRDENRRLKILALVCGGLFLVALPILFGDTMCSRQPSTVDRMLAEDQQQREQAAREEAARRKREAAEQAEREAADRAAREREQRVAAVAEQYRSASPAKRMAAVRDECSDRGGCDPLVLTGIAEAAANDGERKALEAYSAKVRKEHALKAGVPERELFARMYEKAMLDQGLNPEKVTATGKYKTTLTVRIWLCSRQFLYDFEKGTIGQQARAAGFTQVECAGGLEGWKQEL